MAKLLSPPKKSCRYDLNSITKKKVEKNGTFAWGLKENQSTITSDACFRRGSYESSKDGNFA